ncbi:hypothetical protein ACJD0Z_09110 [Flavobacteriaceae bacterium M23B6Z8]
MLKKVLKWILIAVLTLVVLTVAAIFVMDEDLPDGKEGKEADALAMKIYNNLNYQAFEATNTLTWSFPGGHHYEWYRNRGKVNVKWDENEVLLDLVQQKQSTILSPSETISAEKKSDLINTASNYFNNDSFWLIAPYKLFEKGVSRKLVSLENGAEGLLVTYSQGGSTPGDSYLWTVDDQGRPQSYKMWVSIIPIGGLKATWEEWKTTDTGAILASEHKILFLNMKIKNIKAYN